MAPTATHFFGREQYSEDGSTAILCKSNIFLLNNMNISLIKPIENSRTLLTMKITYLMKSKTELSYTYFLLPNCELLGYCFRFTQSHKNISNLKR